MIGGSKGSEERKRITPRDFGLGKIKVKLSCIYCLNKVGQATDIDHLSKVGAKVKVSLPT